MNAQTITRGLITLSFLVVAPVLATKAGLDGLLAISISMWVWLLMPEISQGSAS